MVNSNIKKLKYFSLSLLTSEKLLAYASEKIDTGQIFEANNIFHKSGLFSNKIFGEPGSKERARRNGHIDLKIDVLHPLAYIGITTMSSLHAGILDTTKKARWDNNIKDFVEDDNGETGYEFFMKRLPDIKFTNPNSSDLREFKIRLVSMQDDVKLLSMNKMIVIPASMRDYTIDTKTGRPSQDEVNDIYRKLINSAAMLPDYINKNEYNPFIESIRIRLQKAVVDIYLYLLNLLDGKRGLLRGHLISKAVDYGTRNVITADNSVITRLGTGNHLRFNEMAVGLYQYSKAINPIAIGKLKVLLSRIFSGASKQCSVINIKTLETSIININNKTLDMYTTTKGINSYLNKFADNEFAKKIFGTNEYAFLMILEKDNMIRLVYNTSLIPVEDYKYLRPITNMELVYIVLLSEYDKYYGSTTRYPAINQGSTIPIKPKIKTTNESRDIMVEYDGVTYSVMNYPILTSDVYDSNSPHHSRLARAGADFDGDTANFIIFYTKEANDEIRRILSGRGLYIGADNKLVYSVGTETLNYVVKSMHKLTYINN